MTAQELATAESRSKAEGGRRLHGARKASRPGLPLVSVITVVFNRARHIEETIRAVLAQSYPNVEYIVVDGGSTDGTREIIERYDDRIDYWVSERDRGLYYAMNKAVALVEDTEAYVLFSHSDDRLFSEDSLARAMELGRGADFVYGRTLVSDRDAERIIGRELSRRDLAMETVPHPSTLVRRRVFDTIGFFDTQYRIAADYDFAVRCFTADITRRFVDTIVARMRMWGMSDDQFLVSCRERKNVVRRYFRGRERLLGVWHVSFYDIPRNVVRSLLERAGLLRHWRKLKQV